MLERDGLSVEDAEEHFDFNVQGAYIGPETPGYLVWRVDDEEHG